MTDVVSALLMDADKLRKPSHDPTFTMSIRASFRRAAERRVVRFKQGLREFLLHQPVSAQADKQTSLRAFNSYAYSLLYGRLIDHGVWMNAYIDRAWDLGVEIAKILTPNRTMFTMRPALFYEAARVEMEGLADAMLQRLGRTALEAIMAGRPPSKIYRLLVKEIDIIQNQRLSTFVNTIIVRAHNAARAEYFHAVRIDKLRLVPEMVRRIPTADACCHGHGIRYHRMPHRDASILQRARSFFRRVGQGIGRLFGRGKPEPEALWQWVTAGDDDVCPECEEREGDLLTWQEAQAQIPLHPNCRCSVIPASEII